jgi:hypothetical protein
MKNSARPLAEDGFWIAVLPFKLTDADAYRKGEYKTSLEFAHKVRMPGFWRTQLAIAASCGQLGQQAAANGALDTLLTQRPDIARLPHEELAIWWQPDMVEHLIAGLRKAGLEV